ncbi:MAG: glycerophosphodiester phosphodiesterase family protein [Pseudomonadota bacterium]
MQSALADLIKNPIAHRGLHDGNNAIYENTRCAFQAAIDHGFGIELDVQISADGEAIVFHDEMLDRLTTLSGPVADQTTATLASTNIGSSANKAETLKEILKFVDNRVPVVIELKENGARNEQLARDVARCVREYSGPVSVMSFSHDLIFQLRQQSVSCPVGLTAEGIGSLALDEHRAALDHGIDFISYHIHALPNAFVSDMRSLGKPIITWTVRNTEQARHSAAHADQMTFEGFDPEKEK